MNNEPKAGMNLDPELLAAYIDQRLSPEQRAAVEAGLATDPDSYAVLLETIRALDEIPAARLAPKREVPRWTIAAGILATAAALVLVARLEPDLLQRFRGERSDQRFEQLIAAVGGERSIEGRLSGFGYAPLRPVTRGNSSDANLSLIAAAGELQRIARDRPSAENLHASAIGLLLAGETDQAIDLLERIDRQSASARYRSDLSAAYAARARQQGRAEDWARALDAAEGAVTLDQSLNEAWFNRALALQGVSQHERAAAAWRDYLQRDPNSAWAIESRTRAGAAGQ